MQKRPIGYQPGKQYILDKKIPKSQKYNHIESKLIGKIGTTVKDVQYMSNNQVSKKKGQLFRRIKPTTVWKLINQQTKTQSIYNWNQPEQDARSQTSNLTSITIKTEQLPVDFRQPDQYEQYHIKQSLSFPGPNVNRDKILPQMYHYKNKQKKIIIVYHFDEKKGIQYASQMAERGYDNLYLISGGIEAFGQECTQGLEGKSVPIFEKKEQKKMFKKKRIQ